MNRAIDSLASVEKEKTIGESGIKCLDYQESIITARELFRQDQGGTFLLMSEFSDKFQDLAGFVDNAAKSIMGKLDQFTFKMMVDGLKSNDYEAVKTTIEQLERENRPLSIPPLYFVSQEHPIKAIRDRATKALGKMEKPAELEKATRGKSTEEAVKALIEKYGHYRS